MLHMLVVDDEPYAVDYLVESLEDHSKHNLHITKAYSGQEVKANLHRNKIDVLMTDIRMPGMNGMELADEVLARWPRCRVIFLTGYNDFQYVQSALRKGGVDYVLKTEGDEAIFRALDKAKAEIEAEISEEAVLQGARQQLRQALPTLRREYWLQMMTGETEQPALRAKRFLELGIDLDPHQPVMSFLGKVDDWGKFATAENKALLLFSIMNIAEEYLNSEVRFSSFQYDSSRLVWLIQPNAGESYFALRPAVNNAMERIQDACKRVINIPLSLAAASELVNWEQLGSRVESLKLQLFFRMGIGEEMLITEPAPEQENGRRSSQSVMEVERLRSKLNKLDLLETGMDNGRPDIFLGLFQEWFDGTKGVFPLKGEAEWFKLEFFYRLSAFFLTYVNQRRLCGDLLTAMDAEKLAHPNRHADWQEMLGYFGELGIRIAEYNGRQRIERTNDIIGRVHQYIHEFLHEELSLTKLAELVYLSPPYFSRMYKQMTGKGLLEYINETRINRAKLLLKTTEKKIHEIAAEVGFESAAYFTRLFRKKTSVTPQEYRDSVRAKGGFGRREKGEFG